jgi:3-methylcrotonyl-CoA carboxylase alpha subunit
MILVDDAGHRYDVGPATPADGVIRVRVDGETVDLALEPIAPGTYRVQREGRTETLHCVAEGATIHLFWRGRAYRLRRETASAARAAAGGGTLEAPMPGRVVQVAVAAGDVVAKGQPLLVIEAMKMENVVRAPRDGRVVSIAVEAGARVAPGQPLIELS